MKRRALMQRVAAVGLLGAGGALAWAQLGYPRVTGLRVLSRKEYAILGAIFARLLATTDRDFPAVADVDPVRRVDAILPRLDPDDMRELRALLHVVEHGLPLQHGWMSRFTQLPDRSRDAVLESLRTHRVRLLRGAFAALKSLAAMGYFSDARTFGALGYAGPWIRNVDEDAIATIRLTAGNRPRRMTT